MGVLLKWRRITTEATYDRVQVFRASGLTAPYDLIHTQTIEDNSFYDPDGSSASWYKIRFIDTLTNNISEFSDPIQGGNYFGYCTVDEFRQVINVKPNEVNDTFLATMIEYAGAELNDDINTRVDEEEVLMISNSKKNEKDGANKVFWTKKYPLGDRDNDFRVTPSDITAYKIDKDGVRTDLVTTQVNPQTGQFRLEHPLEPSDSLFISYCSAPRSVDPAHRLIKVACIFLTAHWAFAKLNIGKATRFHMGNLTVFRDMQSPDKYYSRYQRMLFLMAGDDLVAKREVDEYLGAVRDKITDGGRLL